jgi:hypothetical protein
MKRVVQLISISMVWVVVLSGCSGAGVSTASLRHQEVQTFAADHLAALVLVKGWLSALRSYPTDGGECTPDGNFEPMPDGSFHVWGTNSDCSTYDFIDRSGRGDGTWILADGREVGVIWEALEQGPTGSRERVVREFWDGARMEFVVTWEFLESIRVTREGTLTLADGPSMGFVATQISRVGETVVLQLPDGSSCSYRVPLRGEGADGFVPVNEEGVEGLYIAPDGWACEFEARGDADGLNEWEVSADGLRGEFTLGENYSGEGAISRDGRIVGALSWTPSASGSLDLLLAGSAEVGPAGAALDFAVDRWIDNAAALGPMPMY